MHPRFRLALNLALYVIWIHFFKLVSLTFITFFLTSTSPEIKLRNLWEIQSTYQLSVASVSSLGFVLLLIAFEPWTKVSRYHVVSKNKLKQALGPGLVRGIIIALGLSLAFYIGGTYSFFGGYAQLEESPFWILEILLRTLTVFLMVYCDEYIFRSKFMDLLHLNFAEGTSAVATALMFCFAKSIQFDLSWAQILTLFILSIYLNYTKIKEGDFARGAGTWFGALFIFHIFLSQNLLGIEVQGLLMTKPNSIVSNSESFLQWDRFLTGGQGGPLASLSLPLLFLILSFPIILRRKKMLWKINPS